MSFRKKCPSERLFIRKLPEIGASSQSNRFLHYHTHIFNLANKLLTASSYIISYSGKKRLFLVMLILGTGHFFGNKQGLGN